MGGFGSGRQSYRPKVDGALCLDVNRMIALGAICKRSEMHSGVWHWSNSKTGESTAKIGYTFERQDGSNSCIRLKYTVGTTNKHDMDYAVYLDTTPTQFGGTRYWFICPARHIRVAKLYLPAGGKRFLSRQAYGIKYASQSKSPLDRAIQRMHKIAGKVNASGEIFPKPKFMHHKTHKALYMKWADAEQKCDDMLAPYLLKFLQKTGEAF